MTALTRRQREALADLRRKGVLWPKFGRNNADPTTPYTRRTLQALVDADLAEWIIRPGSGIMPHITPTDTKETGTS